MRAHPSGQADGPLSAWPYLNEKLSIGICRKQVFLFQVKQPESKDLHNGISTTGHALFTQQHTLNVMIIMMMEHISCYEIRCSRSNTSCMVKQHAPALVHCHVRVTADKIQMRLITQESIYMSTRLHVPPCESDTQAYVYWPSEQTAIL